MDNSVITSVLSVMISLALTFGIDEWLFIQERNARKDINMESFLIWTLFGGLVLIGIWAVLSWIILVKSRRNKPISIFFIAVGIITFIWYPLQYVIPGWPEQLNIFQHQFLNLQYTGIFIIVLGFLSLLLPNQNAG